VDLGSAPPSNAYLDEATLRSPEKWFPLRVLVCDRCWLVQTEDFVAFDELFNADYAYFSSFSAAWLAHSRDYTEKMIARFSIDNQSKVVEVAANDGYLLQYFKEANIPCLGFEPTASTARAARDKGIEIIESFFGEATAKALVDSGTSADLTAANNVLAHVPDINDFVRGFTTLLKPEGVATFEFPSLLQLITHNQFDTIYHEHFSYLSLLAVDKIFSENGLSVFDVEKLTTHGGSLRVFAQRTDTGTQDRTANVDKALKSEIDAGLNRLSAYSSFQAAADDVKNRFMSFLIEAELEGKTVVGYGAAAKGNTLLNYAGARPDLLSFVVDRNPAKQKKYLPGSRIPIVDESALRDAKADYIVILPWNLRNEIIDQLGYAREWGAKFVTAIPELSIL
jgi:hypothetical protein